VFPQRLVDGRGATETKKLWSIVFRHEDVDAKPCLFQIRVLVGVEWSDRHPVALLPRKQRRNRAVEASAGPDLQLAEKIRGLEF
jgi:hypothetical protein